MKTATIFLAWFILCSFLLMPAVAAAGSTGDARWSDVSMTAETL